jgi:hypothetical protein
VVVNLGLGVAWGEPWLDVLVRDLGLTVFAFGVGITAAGSGTPVPPAHSDTGSREER